MYPKFLKLFLALSMGCFSLVHVHAQDEVYLINGKTIKGREMQIFPNKVTLKTFSKSGDFTEKIIVIPEKKIWYVFKSRHDTFPYPRINMMNGRVRRLQVTGYDSVVVKYRKLGKPSGKDRFFREQFVFSYLSEGREHIVFTPMITDLDTIEVNEARSAFQGKRAARTRYRQPYTAIISALVGLGGGATLAWYGLAPVAIFVAADGLINPRIGQYRLKRYGEQIRDDDYFRYGFNKQAKLLKLRNDVIGGALGVGAGLALIRYLRRQESN
jgi:hypothetical protein